MSAVETDGQRYTAMPDFARRPGFCPKRASVYCILCLSLRLRAPSYVLWASRVSTRAASPGTCMHSRMNSLVREARSSTGRKGLVRPANGTDAEDSSRRQQAAGAVATAT
jgi:hypothetical protein